MPLRIGHTERGYQQAKTIIGAVPDCEYVLVRDWYSALRRVHELLGRPRVMARTVADARFRFRDFDLSPVDLVHLYNGVSYGSRAWISTFETGLPRFGNVARQRLSDPQRLRADVRTVDALERLASRPCKRLIAHSRNAVCMQTEILEIFPEYRDAILAKTVAIPVGQPAFRSSVAARPLPGAGSRSLRAMLVGHDFFRKGGREVLEVLDGLRAAGYPIQLTIVSVMGVPTYASRAGIDGVSWARTFIAERREWITHFPSLPSATLFEQIESCDIGLLPSYAETYGFAVLEFQAHGVPVITTDVRALPEINPPDCGWLIPVPRRPNGEAIYNEPGGSERVSDAIRSGLERTIREIFEDPGALERRGASALARIRSEHSPEATATALKQIYVEAVG